MFRDLKRSDSLNKTLNTHILRKSRESSHLRIHFPNDEHGLAKFNEYSKTERAR